MENKNEARSTNNEKKCYCFPNKPTPGMPVVFDESKCTGCNRCVRICTMDVIMPNPEKGKPPIVVYPEECWYSGDCANECPTGAITFRHPLMSRVHYKNKETGKINRV